MIHFYLSSHAVLDDLVLVCRKVDLTRMMLMYKGDRLECQVTRYVRGEAEGSHGAQQSAQLNTAHLRLMTFGTETSAQHHCRSTY